MPRSIETDHEGRFEAANLRAGTYRVEIVTTSFKKFEQKGVVVRTGGVARVDARLELGTVAETVTVSAEALNNLVTDSPSVAVGLDSQQLRDLPRNGRDMSDFLLLNPNVLGGSDDIQFLGGRTYGVSYVQDGQASTSAIFGTVGNSAPGLDAIAEIQVLSNSYSAEYGGLAGVVVTTKRGGNNYNGSAFYDYNSDGLNALTYNQKQAGAERDDPNADTQRAPLGSQPGRPDLPEQDLLLRELRGIDPEGDLRRRPRQRPDGRHARRRLLRRELHDSRSAHGPAVSRQRDPGEPHRSDGPADPRLLLPAAEHRHALEWHGGVPAVRPRDP